MDNYFPCYSGIGGAGGPCLSRAHGPALWVSMLEKAYARAVGSYTAALGGCCMSRTGGTTEVVDDKTDKERAVKVAEAGVVAKPTKVLAAFTGAPYWQIELESETEKGETKTRPEEENRTAMSTGELWGSIVSRPLTLEEQRAPCPRSSLTFYNG